MDKAKAVASQFIHKAGHHETTVDEKIAPAVVNERIEKERREEVVPVIDKEVHQDHYHTTVQPIVDKQVLPEQHKQNVLPVEQREYVHGGEQNVSARLQQEAAQFKSTRVEGATHESRVDAPALVGEHKHHHVHETIQPVVQKETIQPTVVHTTVPVHEVHREGAVHHTASALPAVSMADYKKQGGVLSGREERYDGFAGEPKTIGSNVGTTGATTGTGIGVGSATATTTSKTATTTTTGTTGHHGTTGTTGTHDTTGTTGKPSLMDKLNPKVDANGDGKAGFMK